MFLVARILASCQSGQTKQLWMKTNLYSAVEEYWKISIFFLLLVQAFLALTLSVNAYV